MSTAILDGADGGDAGADHQDAGSEGPADDASDDASDDPAEPPTDGGGSACAVQMNCTLRGASPTGGRLTGRPFDELLCMPAQDEPDAFEARVAFVSRPGGSRARFVEDMDGHPAAVLDIAGRYLAHGVAVDRDGEPVCVGLPLAIEVTPASELHVQLVWDTPRDPDQDDVCLTCGADVDLHVARGAPNWWHLVDDIFFLNRTPDWGVIGLRSDDPRLDVDDIDGAGPENINFDQLGTDRVGIAVHYFDDNGWGDSFVTLRVYLFGELMFEKVGRPMVEDEFWYVGDFDPGGPDRGDETFEMVDVTSLENRNR